MTSDFKIEMTHDDETKQCKKLSVIKRDGRSEPVQFDKITKRIEKLCSGLTEDTINVTVLTQKVIRNLVDNINVSQIDDLAAMKAAKMSLDHPDYNVLAGRICTSNIQKTTCDTFFSAMELLNAQSILNKPTWEFIEANKEKLNAAIKTDNDMIFDYFSIQTLKRSYLLKIDGKIIETPQYMFMRVACGVNYDLPVEEAIEMYELLSDGIYIHSSPTLFNSGTTRAQMASCFLVDMKEDSIEGIFDTLKTTALISKYAGGVGMNMHDIRSQGSHIKGTNGESGGIVPWLKIFNDTAVAVDQAGRRKGSFAVYLEPHHADFMEFMEIRKAERPENMCAKDLFTAVWTSDLFMERVKNNEQWSFFDPSLNEMTRKLSTVYDDFEDKAYTKLYTELEAKGMATNTIDARRVWHAITISQTRTGTPYIVNKDVANRTSNQKNLGTIRSSNLCAEICQYSAPDETSVCNLASINLSKFVENGAFNYMKLINQAGIVIKNLNKVIDKSFYPTDCSERSNLRHRPLGLGISGLQDVFFMLNLPFTSPKAKEINAKISECLYFGAVLMSNKLAKKYGHYETFVGSPASQGKLNFDLWNSKPNSELALDWDSLKAEIVEHGLRNSLHIALMPTASSASILGVTECFEPQKSNIYKRQVLSGEFIMVNKYLAKELHKRGLWNKKIINKIEFENGSLDNISEIPSEVREVYKTAYDMSMRDIIDMAADRNPFVDQSQSLNLFVKTLDDLNKLSAMIFYSYTKGMKTLIYYLRIKSNGSDTKFTVTNTRKDEDDEQECLSCQA